MGIRLFLEVLDHAPEVLTWRERYALAVLAENANDGTRQCWPGIEDDPQIAHRMRLPARSSRYEVIKALRQKGALETVSGGHRGRRAVYRIPVLGPVSDAGKGPESPDAMEPKASGDPGPNDLESVRDPRTQSPGKRPGTPDPIGEKGSGNDLERVREPHGKGPGIPDPFPSDPSDPSSKPASQQAGQPSRPSVTIPEFARPLVDAISRAGHTHLRWNLSDAEWLIVHACIQRSGTPALAAYAIDQAAARRVSYGRYFLPGWREVAPLPDPATAPTDERGARPGRPVLRAVNGHQPYQCPPAEAYLNQGGF
ncbi:hypothetical protein [Wenjunlia vitaminophila]|uniref:hypothetical protein n=1 Tax=Wenjunlia vitaminophila TaxID=76728 RepID=UPI000370CF78|nr:hypothetical protein [Wenjunlia vitaminophila]